MNKNSDKIILDLCGGTGAWSKPYKDEGYDVKVITYPDDDVVDLAERAEKGNGNLFLNDGIIKVSDIYGILAAPPCTMFSIARNDTTAKEPRDLRSGMEIINSCLKIVHECLYDPYRIKDNNLKFWCLENPASGYLKRFLGRPAIVFNPYDYGDPYTKKTALWGMFNDPIKNEVEPKKFDKGTFVENVEEFFYMKEHQIPEGYGEKTGYSKRKIVRSITPEKFAKAFYEANKC